MRGRDVKFIAFQYYRLGTLVNANHHSNNRYGFLSREGFPL